jgi:type II secretory pathway predicted ATPase ExeA
MSNVSLGSQASLPSGGFAANGFFYSNLHIQETLTTIRYGIEARKGLIVITGETGIGKTTLLHKIAADLAANVTCIVEANPRITFPDVLRLILGNLDIDPAGEDESAMVRSCKLHLRSRLERCQIVTLFFDDAHHLPDRTLRHVIQNFLAGSAEDPDGTLLQLVLAGRWELRNKLSQAALIPLRRRKPMVCNLHPLTSGEVGSYIEQGLISNDRPADLFDARAVKRIALYSKGNPRAVNALCDRALQLAGPTSAITAESIEGAAGELKFGRSGNADEATAAHYFEKPDEGDHPAAFQFASGRFTEAAAPIFPSYPEEERRRNWLPRGEHMTSWVRTLSILIVLVGATAMIRTDSALNLLVHWAQILKTSALPLQSSRRPEVEEQTAPRPEKMVEPDTLVPLPGPDRPAITQYDEPPAIVAAPAVPSPSAPVTDPASSAATENDAPGSLAKTAPLVAPRQNGVRRAPLKEEPKQQSQSLQTQIARAIENRAIMGVEVSVVRGTAYLDGHVATERQRRAAERAARSVVGVERVQNRIAITFG